MSFLGLRIFNRCPFKTETSLYSCDLKRGHPGPHHVPWDPRLPANLTRDAQEDWARGLLEEVLDDDVTRRK